MIRIGITGGIGSGKSYVCNRLKQRGIPVYNCDDEAKRLMAESPTLRQQLSELIGSDIYINNVLNKSAIANYLFANADNAQKINRIVHPAIKEDFLQWASKQKANIVAQECALLFEANFSDTVDKTIEVYAPQPIRLQRAMQRDHATQEQIEARMKQQMPEEEKQALADYCILNDGTQNIEEQLDTILQDLRINIDNP